MKTKAVRLYGKQDLRLEEFDLPQIKDDEILARVVSDSLCLSSYKAAIQGSDHKRVPDDVAENPVIVGHEFCGELLEIGSKWAHKFKAGDKFTIQPALMYKGSLDAPGYSYQYIGGDATYIVIPNEVMEMDCLLKYQGDAYFLGSLAEPMSCIIGAFHAQYHIDPSAPDYKHIMEIKPGGNTAILAAAGPMGLGAVDYAINAPIRPSLIVVTDIDEGRLARAKSIISPEMAQQRGIKLVYVNPNQHEDANAYMMSLTGGTGYDDVFAYTPVRAVVEMGDAILARDGCLNFFAGPTKTDFSALLNFYNVHYGGTHIVGTSGGKTVDLKEALEMLSQNKINPAAMFSHIGGLNCVPETTLALHDMRAGKVLIYTHKDLPLTAIEDFGKVNSVFFAKLDEIVKRHNGMWNVEAEEYLLQNAPNI